MDASLLIAAGASFVAGLTGYIIARLWITPIVRYNLTKGKLRRELSRYRVLLEVLDAPRDRSPDHGKEDRSLTKARRHASALTACYNEQIPYWYRLLLDSRKESPADASGLLTNLNKIRDPKQLENRIVRAQKALGIK